MTTVIPLAGRPAAEPPEPPRALVAQWAGCGIVAAAARFVPVPLLDDAIREAAGRLAVARTLRHHGRPYPAGEVAALYLGVEASLSARARRYLRSVPRRVLLFPVRKYVALFGSVRGVPEDVTAVVLVCRALSRHLAQGGLAAADTPAARAAEARRLRQAVDDVRGRMDLQLLVRALGEALSQGRALSGAAVRQARVLVRRHAAETAAADDSAADDSGAAVTEAAADAVTDSADIRAAGEASAEALARPDVQALLREFDARVAAQLVASR